MAIDAKALAAMQGDLADELERLGADTETATAAFDKLEKAVNRANSAAAREAADRMRRSAGLGDDKDDGGKGLSGQIGGAMASLKGGLGNAGAMIGEAVAGPLGAMVGGSLKDIPGMLMAPFDVLKGAVMSVKDAFDSVAGAVKPYVQAFAPSTVQAFDMAMRDTTAVIGYALVPVLQSCTQIVRAFGDAILPTMRQLEPAIREVSGVLQGVLGQLMTTFGGALRGAADGMLGLLDLLRPALPVFTALIDTWRVAGAIVQAFHAQLFAFSAMMTEGVLGLKGGFQSVGDAMRKVAAYTLIAAASMAKLFGMDAAIKQMKRAFGEGQDKGASTGMAAAQNAQIMDVSAWSKQVALQMATAQGTGGESKEDIFQAAILTALDKVDTMDVKKELGAKIDELKTQFVAELRLLPGQFAEKMWSVLPPHLRGLRPRSDPVEPNRNTPHE